MFIYRQYLKMLSFIYFVLTLIFFLFAQDEAVGMQLQVLIKMEVI